MEKRLTLHLSANMFDRARNGPLQMVAVWAKPESNQIGSCRLQQFPHAPNVIGDLRFHGGSNAERLVDATKIVEREPARDSGPVVLPFLAEAIRQAREAAKAHANAKILAFHNAGADALGIGLPVDWDSLHGCYFGGRVPRFAFLGGSVDFDELREASKPIMQRRSDGGAVRREAIGSDLERRPCSSVADAFYENIRGGLVALAHRDVQHQLAVALDRDKNVTIALVLIVFGPDALLFLADKTPQFVALQIAYWNVDDFRRHNAFALFASKYQKLEDRGVVDAGNTLDTRHAVTFQQKFENRFSVINGGVHPVKRGLVWFGEGLRALTATKALKSVAVLSEALAFGTAVVARHSGLELSSGQVHNGRGTRKSLALGFGLRLNLAGSSNYLRGLVYSWVAPAGFGPASPRSQNRRSVQIELRGHKNSLFTFGFPFEHLIGYLGSQRIWRSVVGRGDASQRLQDTAIRYGYSISSFFATLDSLNFPLTQESSQDRVYFSKKIGSAGGVNLTAGNQDIADLNREGQVWISCAQYLANSFSHAQIQPSFAIRKRIQNRNRTVLKVDRFKRLLAFPENRNLFLNCAFQVLQSRDLRPNVF